MHGRLDWTNVSVYHTDINEQNTITELRIKESVGVVRSHTACRD